jgi:hypothetical protein
LQKGKGARGAVASLATWQRAVGGSTVDRVRRGVHRSTVDRAERGAHTGSGGGRPAAAVRHGRGSELRRDGEPGHGEASRGRWRVAGGTAEPMRARVVAEDGRGVLSARRRRLGAGELLRRARVGPREREGGRGWVGRIPHLVAIVTVVSLSAGTQRARDRRRRLKARRRWLWRPRARALGEQRRLP